MLILDRKFTLWALFFLLAFLAGCASNPSYFASPSDSISANDRELFAKALREQGKGRYDAAKQLWQAFLQEHPNSFEAHNNLGMVFFMDDRLAESIPEFEAAHKWAPFSERIRANLSRAYQVQVAVMREDREFDVAIRHLKNLSAISTSMEKEKVLFMIEELDHELFESLKKLNTAEGFEDYVKRYPQGPNAREARQRLEDLRKTSSNTSADRDTLAGKVDGEPGHSDENNMGTVAELEDITEEILAAGKAPVKEKSLPPMPDGAESLPLPEAKPGTEQVDASESQAAAVATGALQSGLWADAEAVPEADSPTKMLLADLAAVAKESSAVSENPAPDGLEMDGLKLAMANETKSQPSMAAEMDAAGSGPAIAGTLSRETVLEMEALAEESGSSQPAAAPAMLDETVAAPVVADMLPPVAIAVKVKVGSPEVEVKVAPVEASPPVLAKARPAPAVGTEMAAPFLPEKRAVARLPETIARPKTVVPIAAKVAREKLLVKIIVQVRSSLKVRARPSLNAKIVGRLKNNDIRVLVKEVNGWYKVEHIDGRTGWISQRYSKKFDDGSDIINMITDNHQAVRFG